MGDMLGKKLLGRYAPIYIWWRSAEIVSRLIVPLGNGPPINCKRLFPNSYDRCFVEIINNIKQLARQWRSVISGNLGGIIGKKWSTLRALFSLWWRSASNR